MENFLWDRYAQGEPIGQGGMGQIYKARDIGLDREVAIKRLRPDLSTDPDLMARFVGEARATGQLEHPNIPPIYEMGRDPDGKPYFALKLIRGQSLAQIIERLRTGDAATHEEFSFPYRLQIFAKVCEAVAYAHARGVLHRDIKPANIMVGEFGEVFLMDWGLAKFQQKEQNVTETQPGTYLVTPMYAAPEQLEEGTGDARSDVYSLGATLYEWLTLHTPFAETKLAPLVTAVLTKQPRDPMRYFHARQGRVSPELTRLVLRAMAKQPSRRFQTANDLLLEIRMILAGEIHPFCPCTTVKFGFRRISDVLDDYPILAAVVIPWLLYPLWALGQAAWNTFH